MSFIKDMLAVLRKISGLGSSSQHLTQIVVQSIPAVDVQRGADPNLCNSDHAGAIILAFSRSTSGAPIHKLPAAHREAGITAYIHAALTDCAFAAAKWRTSRTPRQTHVQNPCLRPAFNAISLYVSGFRGQVMVISNTCSSYDDNELRKALQNWNDISERHKYNIAEQKLLDKPYIIEKNQDGAPVKILIANQEGKNWYDQLLYTEISHLYNFGMIKPGDTVFDCGANHGVNSLVYCHAVGPTGFVHAFDPFPLNADIFNFNMRLNNITNVRHHLVGLSNEEKYVIVSAVQQSASVKENSIDAPDAVSIKLDVLDNYADLQPDFIKLDIEGSEINALLGAKKILDREPTIYVEIHTAIRDNFGQDMMDIFDVIDMHRYECYIGHPKQGMIKYHKDILIDFHCQLYFIPKNRPFIRRIY